MVGITRPTKTQTALWGRGRQVQVFFQYRQCGLGRLHGYHGWDADAIFFFQQFKPVFQVKHQLRGIGQHNMYRRINA
jgi:hypothetical protein